jgi:divalent metal cation (Fe/Co/Zn/Cd) transporter
VLAVVALVSNVAATQLGQWWADPVGAIAIAVVLAREGVSAVREGAAT